MHCCYCVTSLNMVLTCESFPFLPHPTGGTEDDRRQELVFLRFLLFSFSSKSPETVAVKSKTVKTCSLNLIRLKSAGEFICGKMIPDYFYEPAIY